MMIGAGETARKFKEDDQRHEQVVFQEPFLYDI